MERLLTLEEPVLPDHLRWQAVSFMRVVWPDIDGGALRATYPPALAPVHHLVVDDDLLLAYAATFVQPLVIAGVRSRVGCLGNVFTYPGTRRRGHGGRVVTAASRHLQTSDVDVGVLLCAPALAPFYARLGWRAAVGPTLVQGPGDGPPTEVDALRMVLPVADGDGVPAAGARSAALLVPFAW